MWSGALIYLVVLGMVARVEAQVAGRAGARYFDSFPFCLNGKVLWFGEPRRHVFNAVERGMLHDLALVFSHAECIAASVGAQCSCIVFCCWASISEKTCSDRG